MRWLRVLILGRCDVCQNPRRRGYRLCSEHLLESMRQAVIPPGEGH